MSYHLINIAENIQKVRTLSKDPFVVAFTLILSLMMAGVLIVGTEAQSSALVQPVPATAAVGVGYQVNNVGTQTAPELLYILDSNHEREREGQVLLVDTAEGRVLRTFKAGYRPDMVLSRDGSRLYIASTWWTPDRWGGGTLDVFDTASGALLKRVDNPERGLSTVPWYPSKMAISSNGRWLYIYKVHQTLDGDEHYVATLDIVKARFLSESRKIPFCGQSVMRPLPADHQFAVVCRESSDVRFLDLAPKRKARNKAPVSVAGAINAPSQKVSILAKGVSEHGRRVGPSFLSSDGATLTVIMGDGRFFRIDNASRKIIETGTVDRVAEINTGSATGAAQEWLADSWIRYQTPALSQDGKKLYVGVGRLIHLRHGVDFFDRIAVFDPQTLKLQGLVKTSQLFYSLELSKDGRHLYAISPEQASIMVIDTATGVEIRAIYGIGVTPIRAIVAP